MANQTLAELQAENARLRESLAEANRPKPITLRVSEKGAVSVYGMGRFPVTLYAGQWERLLDNGEAIKAFIAEYASKPFRHTDAKNGTVSERRIVRK